ncbi:MAG: two-component system response regulator YesN [Gammaproteobacteria bacterium]|nr:MAG: two-component system response regulator YesN [Gammaproteobacteria bacterium]TND05275.1 MAG: two-component system, response regulator YesN [Gammaproteobacteria bacterium]
MNARISRIVCYINAHYRDPVTQASVAARFRIHPDYLSRRFKIEVGMRFHQYLLWKRLEYAKGLLTNTSSSIKQVGYDSGFSCPETFSKTFRRAIGCSPRAYRNRGGLVSMAPRAGGVPSLLSTRSN